MRGMLDVNKALLRPLLFVDSVYTTANREACCSSHYAQEESLYLLKFYRMRMSCMLLISC